jgi:3-isopropylmalate/(R)-2-methylmalate dehydratase small subunit
MEVTVDLAARRIGAGGFARSFAIDPFYRECLLNGWDEIALTLRQEAVIARYEAARRSSLPTTVDTA